MRWLEDARLSFSPLVVCSYLLTIKISCSLYSQGYLESRSETVQITYGCRIHSKLTMLYAYICTKIISEEMPFTSKILQDTIYLYGNYSFLDILHANDLKSEKYLCKNTGMKKGGHAVLNRHSSEQRIAIKKRICSH